MASPAMVTAANVTALNADLDATAQRLADAAADVTVFWLLYGGALVFFMQAGFGMLEAGCVRSTSVVNIVFKNLMDACVGAVMFYLLGWALAYGDDTDAPTRNAFVGNAAFALVSDAEGGYQDGLAAYGGFEPRAFAMWFFQFAFCATAATIVSGAVAERLQLRAYFVYSAWITGFVYPVVVHWCWSTYGWASPFTDGAAPRRLGRGLQDFAGSGVVHMVGGFAALAGAIVLGPRRGRRRTAAGAPPPLRFSPGADPEDFVGHNKVYQVLGMFILWTGWFGFNCVSTLEMSATAAPVAARVAVTTMLGAAGGGFTAVVCDVILQRVALRGVEPTVDPVWRRWAGPDADHMDPPPEAILGRAVSYDIACVVNGVLAGLVSITAGCATVEPWAAATIGALGAVVYTAASRLLCRLHIDDPLDAFAVHGAAGYWGVIAVGLFATAGNVREVYAGAGMVLDGDGGNANASAPAYYGAFYGGDGKQLGVQLLVGLVIAVWSFVTAGVVFLTLGATGNLRVGDEVAGFGGVDKEEHAVRGYTMKDGISKLPQAAFKLKH